MLSSLTIMFLLYASYMNLDAFFPGKMCAYKIEKIWYSVFFCFDNDTDKD